MPTTDHKLSQDQAQFLMECIRFYMNREEFDYKDEEDNVLLTYDQINELYRDIQDRKFWIMKYIGNCVDSFDEFGDCIIPQLPFSNVTEFAQLVEESDNVEIGDFIIQYDEETDVHSFFFKWESFFFSFHCLLHFILVNLLLQQ